MANCLLVVFILCGAWPKSNVWYEIMNGETEAVRARIEAGFDFELNLPRGGHANLERKVGVLVGIQVATE